MARGLFGVLAQATLSHHLVHEVVHHHEKKEHLALLSTGHAPKHLQEFRVYLLGQRRTVYVISHAVILIARAAVFQTLVRSPGRCAGITAARPTVGATVGVAIWGEHAGHTLKDDQQPALLVAR